jgi:hypothetical protein
MMARPRIFTKDPDARLDWKFDYDLWLEAEESILSAEILTEGVTVDDRDVQPRSVKVWLVGGTAGVTAQVTCRITTILGRIDDRTIRIRIRER